MGYQDLTWRFSIGVHRPSEGEPADVLSKIIRRKAPDNGNQHKK